MLKLIIDEPLLPSPKIININCRLQKNVLDRTHQRELKSHITIMVKSVLRSGDICISVTFRISNRGKWKILLVCEWNYHIFILLYHLRSYFSHVNVQSWPWNGLLLLLLTTPLEKKEKKKKGITYIRAIFLLKTSD